MFKRSLTIAAGILGFCMLFVTVSGAQEVKKPKMVCNLYHYWTGVEEEYVNAQIGVAQKKLPNIKIYRNAVEAETYKMLIKVMLAGESPPDVFTMFSGTYTEELVNMGAVMNLTNFWEENNLDEILSPAAKKMGTFDGKIYYTVNNMYMEPVWYNKQVFNKLGLSPPTNWDEFLHIMEVLKTNGITPITMGNRERWVSVYWFDYLLRRIAGPEFYTGLMRGEESWLDPKVVEVFKMWKDLIEKGYFQKNPNALDWKGALPKFINGETAIIVIGSYIQGVIADMAPDFKVGVDYDYFLFPPIKPGITQVQVGMGDGWLIAKNARHPKAAKKVLLELVSAEAQEAFVRRHRSAPTNVRVPIEEFFTPTEVRIAKDLRKYPVMPTYDACTPAEVADVGMDGFARLLDQPQEYMNILREIETAYKKYFKK